MRELQTIFEHQICQQKYYLDTIAINQLSTTIDGWIRRGLVGGVVWGYPRCGKSTAIRQSIGTLETRSGMSVPSVVFNMKSNMIKTDNKFFDGILMAMKHAFSGKGNSLNKLGKILEFFTEEALQNDEKRVVLVIDEAQKMTPFEYNLVSDIHNDLADNDIDLSIVYVGSIALIKFIEDYKISGGYDAESIVGRYFTTQERFYGLRSERELRFILKDFDKRHLQTIKKFIRVEEEFTFSSMALQVWSAYKAYSKHYNMSEWKMRYVSSAITMLFVDYLTQYSPDEISEEDLIKIIDLTGVS
jgi:hypothetical protein